MQLNKEQLLENLSRCWSVVDKARTNFSCFRFKGDKLQATNRDIFIQVNLPFDTGLDILVEAGRLYKYLKEVQTEEVDFNADEKDLRISSKNSHVKFGLTEGFAKEDFDNVFSAGMNEEEPKEWKQLPEGFFEIVDLCRFSTAQDFVRGALNGVIVDKDKVFSTDGYRLTCKKFGEQINDSYVSLPLNLVVVILVNKDKLTLWGTTEKGVYFKSDNVFIVGSCITGTIPSIEGLLSSVSKENKFTFPKDFISVLNRHLAQLVEIEGKEKKIKLKLEKGVITVFSTDNFRYEMEEVVGEDSRGLEFEIILNPMLLKDILNISNDMYFDNNPKVIKFEKDDVVCLLATF